ncbi:hypothetical protein KBB12_01685 [Candidatus Woesebacteria bacterium]|nr:hypothetical protein [Candidatus Woesebacteria bacterium]
MNKTKILIIIGTMALVWLFLIYILLAKLKSNDFNASVSVSTTTPTRPPNTPTPKRTYVTLANNQLLSSTGDANDAPAPEVTASAQRGNLLASLPVRTEVFQIVMDYKQAKYVATFTDKTNVENKNIFQKWLQQNYPDMSIEEFIVD